MPKGTTLSRRIGHYPSKLPKDYVEKTLKRLIPSTGEIDRLSVDQLIILNEEIEQLRPIIEAIPIKFFQPSVRQAEFLDWRSPRHRLQFVVAGNKFGKSTVGAIKSLEYALGEQLWGDNTRDFKPFMKTPNRGCVFAEDFDSHKEVTVPSLFTWAPQGSFIKDTRNTAQQTTELICKNNSIIHFRTFEQGFDKAEGKDWDWVWIDEPPPRDLYISIFRGLVAKGGLLLLTATLVKEGWLYDEADKPYVKIFEGTIHDNLWIDDQAKRDFIDALDDDEKEVRETGRPKSLTGLIYKGFRDRPPHVLDDQPRPTNCPIILGVDPHERKSIHVLYTWIDPQDRLTAFRAELVPANSLTEIFDKLEEYNEENGENPVCVVIDPNRGKARQMGGRSWGEEFESRGYFVIYGNDALHMGHSVVREYLKFTDEIPPAFKFLETCRGKRGPIHHMMRYAWDDYKSKLQRTQKETPKDAYKDWPDVVRYLCMEMFEYKIIRQGHQPISIAPKSWTDKGGLYAPV